MNKFTKLAVMAFSLIIVNQVFALDWHEKQARKQAAVDKREQCIASCLRQKLDNKSFNQCEKKCNEDFRRALRDIYCYNNHYSCADNVINEMNSFFVYSLTID
jgi:hypothetical protein